MKSTVNEDLQVPLKKVLRNTRPEDGTRGKPMDTMEPPYTVKEVAALTGWSVQTVIRIHIPATGDLRSRQDYGATSVMSWRSFNSLLGTNRVHWVNLSCSVAWQKCCSERDKERNGEGCCESRDIKCIKFVELRTQ